MNANVALLVVVPVLGFAAGCAPGCSGSSGPPPPGPQSGIIVLVDFSRSFAPLTQQDHGSLKTLGHAAVELARRVSQPVKIQWSAVTSDSLKAPSLCGGPRMFRQQLTSLRPAPPSYIIRLEDLRRWTADVCPDVVLKMSQQNLSEFTDISGAISLASDSLSTVAGDRFLIVYSDLLEDQPDATTASLHQLTGFRILLVWRPGMDSPEDMDGRHERWKQAFRRAGASATCTFPASSLTTDDVMACLLKGATNGPGE